MRRDDMIFIAEIGMNHNGNFGLLFELIRQAANSGADFAKFQLGWRCGPGEINRLGSTEVELINRCCSYHNFKPLFSIITPDAWELVKKFDYVAYKIASRTVVDNPELVEDILSVGKRTFISLGMTDEPSPFGRRVNIDYMWCKSEYPLLPWNIRNFPKIFTESTFCGYSDHTIGIDVALLAISRGAKIVEKHFSLDKSDTTIRDHALSATPDEFRQLTLVGRAIHANLKLGI